MADAGPATRKDSISVVRGRWQERSFSGHTVYGAADGEVVPALSDGSGQNGIGNTVQIDFDALSMARCVGASRLRNERVREGDGQGPEVSSRYQSGTSPDSMPTVR